ncbi:MAG: hypothetical protein KKC76_17735 [Proteobacteria bacterium]|nr:hypothetical protein [Pseudomonadota bacterium]MBU4296155.1 hypothetical protein [Pseudomonadota bacterium]MCG2746775.1 hypothetical protein [Desulfobulbaceae bacterium]
MSKASQIIILCEDKAHELFVKRFLRMGWDVKPRAIRVPPYPNGKGSGKKHVEDNISLEAEALRRRPASTILLVIQDADELSVGQIRSNLDAKLLSPRNDNEPIAYIIPKWHIQTWIAYLDGRNVNEADKDTYKNSYGKLSESKDAHPFIDRLANNCRKNIQLKSPPDSLVAACEEFNRIRSSL